MDDYVVFVQPNNHIILGVNDDRVIPETETIIQIMETVDNEDQDHTLKAIMLTIIGTAVFMVIGIMYIILIT
tara:strand:- start:835 stop:1050 length:216 start_codon:yes stop_codon:yes gene_type:complete